MAWDKQLTFYVVEYGATKKELEVVNVNGSNSVKVRELTELLGKEVSYDNGTKITDIK